MRIQTATMTDITVDGIRLTRVPYFDVPLDASVIALSTAEVAAIPWARPTWATPDGHVLVGQAVWVIQTDTHLMVVDPCGAADAFLRTGSEAIAHQAAVIQALDDAGFAVNDVDAVVLSHLDGIGMAAAVNDGGQWIPLFPRGKVILSQAELERVRANPGIDGAAALLELLDQGVVDTFGSRLEPAPGVVLEMSGGHSAGHSVIRVGQGGVFLGHLAISPLNLAFEARPNSHEDATLAGTILNSELHAAAMHQKLLIGPLWPDPGCAYLEGPPWTARPA